MTHILRLISFDYQITRDTAEINFNTQESAKRAVGIHDSSKDRCVSFISVAKLQGKSVRGKTLSAALISELNGGTNTISRGQRSDSKSNEKSVNKLESESGERKSILDRIKKRG